MSRGEWTDERKPMYPHEVIARLAKEHQKAPATASGRNTPAPGEVRVVNPMTGGEKGSKPARFDLMPARALWEVAEHYGKGAEKYDDHNWRRGYDWSLSLAALMRHLYAFLDGEDIDPETGSCHMAAVVFHALALLEFRHTHPELDDRWRGGSNGPS